MATRIRACVLGLAGMFFTVTTPLEQSEAKTFFQASSPRRYVEIQYWLQTSDGRRLTERMAPSVTGRFKLHLQSNTEGFLAVWTTANGRLLTPAYEGFAGHKIQSNVEYVVPGDFRTSGSEAEGLVVVLFARSQTEQVWKVEDALNKLSRLLPLIVKRSDETPGSVGTFVGNPDGGPLGVTIPLTR